MLGPYHVTFLPIVYSGQTLLFHAVRVIISVMFVCVTDEIKREDLARSLLVAVVMDMVHHLMLNALDNGIKHVFFSGSFMSTYLMRYVITAEFARRNANYTMLSGRVGSSRVVTLPDWMSSYICL